MPEEQRLVHLVDDDEAVRRSASFMLRTSNFLVKTYASGIELLAVNIVGGETSIIGAVIGSLFFTYLPELMRVFGKEAYPTYFGLITLAVLILLPNGIMGLLRSKEA